MAAPKRRSGSKRRSSTAPPPSPEVAPPAKAEKTDASASSEASATATSGPPELQGGDPAVLPATPLQRSGLNLLIGALLCIFGIDALPNSIPGLGRLNQGIDIVVDKLGLAQGEWKLFSPDPDHINAYVEAIVSYDNGETRTWTTHEWRERSLFTKFIQGRYPKFSDAFRMDRNKLLWPRLCDWIVTQVQPPPGARVTKVELKRHWWDVPKPADLAKDAEKYQHMPPHREEYQHHFSFHTKEYR